MLWRNQHGWTMSLLSEINGHDKSLHSMSQPTFPVKDTACYFSKYAEYIFFISWFIMTRGSNCKTEMCKNEGEKITGLCRRSWHILTVFSLLWRSRSEDIWPDFLQREHIVRKNLCLNICQVILLNRFIELNDT